MIMKTVLICHSEAQLTRLGFARWLASFSNLVGIVEIREKRPRKLERVRSEIRRVGLLRFVFDVFPYRVYSRIVDGPSDRHWENRKMEELRSLYPDLPASVEVLVTDSPNTDAVRDFLARLAPDLVVARCKTLIKKEIFEIPTHGIVVLHPGICPEYRNAYGCFWAIANNEPDKVGMTLLRIDAGIDTGPIYGYFSYPYDVARESVSVIQNRVVYDNLDGIREKLMEINAGSATPLTVSDRESNVWGQPWLSHYLRMKRNAGMKK